MKRNFTYLKSLLLVMLICTGSGSVWGQSPDWQYAFTSANDLSATSGSVNTLNGWSWTFEYNNESAPILYDALKGLQIGSSSNPAKSATLSTSSGTSKIVKIVVNTSGASSIAGNFMVFVGDMQIGSSYKLTTTANAVSFEATTPIAGQIKLVWSQTSSKAIYIKNIQVFYQQSNVQAPTITPEAGTFYESATVTLSAPEADEIYYTTDVTKDPTVDGTVYSSPLTITETTTIKAAAKKGTDFSSVVTAVYQIKKLTAALPYTIDFKEDFGDCIVKKVSGDTEWENTAEGASINGYKKGTCESWIITPAVTAKDLSFNFTSGTRYSGPGLALLYSADYDPTTMNDPNEATWTDITTKAQWPVASGKDVVRLSSDDINLKGLGSPVRIAFKYTGTNDSAALWEVGALHITDITPISEVSPENVESIGQLAQNITASGDWAQTEIESLALVIADNSTPVTSVKFTGSVTSDNDEIITMNSNCLKIFADGVVAPDAWTINVVKLDASGNATSESIVIDATFAFGTPVKITADAVSFLREGLVAGNKSTIYLPFATSVPEGAAAFTFNKVEGTTVKFTPAVGALAANTPYLFTPNGTDLAIEETNVDILPAPEATPATGYEFLGTYEEIPAVGFYGFKDNSFKLGIAGATVPAFRAYLKPATLPSGAPAVLSIDVNGEGTTGIENAVFEGTTIYATDDVVNVLTDQTQKVSIYGIDGKLVRSETVNPGMNTIRGLAKGMYVVNNQKLIIK